MIGKQQWELFNIFDNAVHWKAKVIIAGISHPLYSEFKLLPSGWFRALRASPIRRSLFPMPCRHWIQNQDQGIIWCNFYTSLYYLWYYVIFVIYPLLPVHLHYCIVCGMLWCVCVFYVLLLYFVCVWLHFTNWHTCSLFYSGLKVNK